MVGRPCSVAEMWEYSGLRAVGRERFYVQHLHLVQETNKHKKACMCLFKSYLLCEMLCVYSTYITLKLNNPGIESVFSKTVLGKRKKRNSKVLTDQAMHVYMD